MPNWNSNALSVKGNKKDIAALAKFVKGKDNDGNEMPFDFEKVLPTPPELLQYQSPMTDEAKAKEFMDKYGAEDWYNWRVKNWGTKWNLDSEITFDVGDKFIDFSFDTAWSPPVGIIKELARKFPKLTFSLTYCEPGNTFAGVFTAEGEWTNDIGYDPSSKEYASICEEMGYGDFIEENP